MNESMIRAVRDELKLHREAATELLAVLPKEVTDMFHNEHQKSSFFEIVASYYNGTDDKYRLEKNMSYLINKLNARYIAAQISLKTGIAESTIKSFLENKAGLSVHSINKLAALVDLTVSFQDIGESYRSMAQEPPAPRICGFNAKVYNNLGQQIRLPSPSEVGKESVVKRVRIGDGNSHVTGFIESISDSYMGGSLERGDAVSTLFFEIEHSTLDWIRQENPERVIMTIDGTSITSEQILNSISENVNSGEEYTATWMTMIKVPKSKKVNVTFLADSDLRTSTVDFTQLRIMPIRKGVIILGGIK